MGIHHSLDVERFAVQPWFVKCNPSFLAGPELALVIVGASIFWFCANHNSGEGDDVRVLEKLIILLPFIVVPLVFATIFVPGARNWGWLSRFIVFTYAMLTTCAGRIISGFGTGAKGQDAAFIMVMIFGTMAIAMGTAIASATILYATQPKFAAWFASRKPLAAILTLLASVPIAMALGFSATLAIGILAAFYTGFK